jgi:microcystin degradation protein MlrC
MLRFANVTVLVTSLPGYTQDVEAFRSQGIDLREYDVIVTKSGYHFKLSFGEIGPCVVVDTPGISNYRPGLLPYRRRRPVFPEDRVSEPSFEPSVFSPRFSAACPEMRKPPADLREQELRSSRN